MTLHEEVSAPAARFFGHVCGVIAVAMAAFSGWALWQIGVAALQGRFAWTPSLLVLLPVTLTVLFFRWAAVLSSERSSAGRLSVPPSAYVAFGLFCAALSGFGLYLLLTQTLTFWGSLKLAAGVISGGVVAYWCHLLLKSRRK